MSETPVNPSPDDASFLAQFPPLQPAASLLWTAIVDVGAPVDLGETAKGQRFMVPIKGGKFFGAGAFRDLYGTVLPGGADRQLLRRDGVKELEAIYEMRTADGTILSICNRVTVDQNRTPERYAMSVLDVTAPEGPHAWLSRRLIVGTLQSARPEQSCVIVRAWVMDT